MTLTTMKTTLFLAFAACLLANPMLVAAPPCAPPTLDQLPLLPRHVSVHQFSSHNKQGINGDAGWFLYKDEHGDSVVFDAMGPGCLRSFWQTWIQKDQILKFYFDDEPQPRYTIPALDLYRGKHRCFPPRWPPTGDWATTAMTLRPATASCPSRSPSRSRSVFKGSPPSTISSTSSIPTARP